MSINSYQEKQRKAFMALLLGKYVFALFLIDIKSLIDGWFIKSPCKYFLNVYACYKKFSMTASQMVPALVDNIDDRFSHGVVNSVFVLNYSVN